LARRFVIGKKMAEDIVDQIITIFSDHWTSFCKSNGGPEDENRFFGTYIERQREKLAV